MLPNSSKLTGYIDSLDISKLFFFLNSIVIISITRAQPVEFRQFVQFKSINITEFQNNERIVLYCCTRYSETMTITIGILKIVLDQYHCT